MSCTLNEPPTGLICGNVNRVRKVWIASENETVSFVIVSSVSVNFVTVIFVTVWMKALHSSSTSLTLCENVNTLVFFCRISPTESLKRTFLWSESVIDPENENEIVSFRDGAFPSLGLAFLKKTIQILTYRDHQLLIVFSLWSDIFLLRGKVNVNVNENVNVIDGCLFFLFVFHLNVSDPARSVIQHGRCEIHRVRFSCLWQQIWIDKEIVTQTFPSFVEALLNRWAKLDSALWTHKEKYYYHC